MTDGFHEDSCRPGRVSDSASGQEDELASRGEHEEQKLAASPAETERGPQHPSGPDDRGFAGSFGDRVWCVLFHQQRVFGMPFEGSWDRRALWFAMQVAAMTPLLQQGLLYLLLLLLPVLLPSSVPLISVVEFLPARLSVAELVRYALLVPVLLPIPIVLYAGLLHVLLRLAQSGERGYAVTLQTVCYASACWLFVVLPGNGVYLALIWWLGVQTVGLRLAHRSPWSRVLPVMAMHVSAAAWLVFTAIGWVVFPV